MIIIHSGFLKTKLSIPYIISGTKKKFEIFWFFFAYGITKIEKFFPHQKIMITQEFKLESKWKMYSNLIDLFIYL